jgi:hypothetical protein
MFRATSLPPSVRVVRSFSSPSRRRHRYFQKAAVSIFTQASSDPAVARPRLSRRLGVLHQIGTLPGYEILVPRTLALSFAEFLIRVAQASAIAISASSRVRRKIEESR